MRLENENVQDIGPFGVRMPSELKAKIKAAAKANRHSMNAEIVERLEKSFPSESNAGWPGGFDNFSQEDVSKAFKVMEWVIRGHDVPTGGKP